MTGCIGRPFNPLGVLELVNAVIDGFLQAYRTATTESDMTVTVYAPAVSPRSHRTSQHYSQHLKC